jgi:curli biogenesis system outer membrane secretion channel CsgG
MVSTEAFQVLERKELNAVISEQDLGASGRISSATKAKMKKIKGARLLIAGTVSAYEEDTKGVGGGVSLGPVSLGGKKNSAYLAVDVKVIDTDTGEIVDARTIEARAEGSALGAGLSLSNFSIHGGGYEKTPTGKAIRACIVYICEYLECSMTKGKNDDCMDKWREMESKRKSKTKDSIKLD